MGTPPSQLGTASDDLAPPLLRDASDEDIEAFLNRVRERVVTVQQECRDREQHYREGLARDYARAPVHDGTLDTELRPLQGGEYVIIRRARRLQFGVASKGPFLVVRQLG